jgi:hypothetical protein
MKITTTQLRKIINEEVKRATLKEGTSEKFSELMQDVLNLIQKHDEVYEAHMTGNRIVITLFSQDGTGTKPGAYLDFSLFSGEDTF